jgi:hypothetical protein
MICASGLARMALVNHSQFRPHVYPFGADRFFRNDKDDSERQQAKYLTPTLGMTYPDSGHRNS